MAHNTNKDQHLRHHAEPKAKQARTKHPRQKHPRQKRAGNLRTHPVVVHGPHTSVGHGKPKP